MTATDNMRSCHVRNSGNAVQRTQANLGWMMVVLVPALAVAWWSMLVSPSVERLLSVSPL